jgi:hypothetical protein
MDRVITYPPESYLLLLGKVDYALSYLDSLIFGDLRAHKVVDIDSASRMEMGKQIPFLSNIKKDPAHFALVGYVTAAENALSSVLADRNSFVHASAATDSGGDSVKYRWAIAKGIKPHEALELDEVWLRRFCHNIEGAITTLSALRVPIP